jgi:hypothetical protein
MGPLLPGNLAVRFVRSSTAMPTYQFTIVRVLESFDTYQVNTDTASQALEIAQNILSGETQLESICYDEQCTETYIQDDEVIETASVSSVQSVSPTTA